MRDAALELGGTVRIGAARRRFVVADDRLAAGWTALRHLIGNGIFRSVGHFHGDDLRDDVACLLNENGVPDSDIALADIVDVMERRGGNGRAGELYRFKNGARREYARPAHLNDDVGEPCRLALRRKFIGDRPFRRAGILADLDSFRKVVDLDDDPVDIEGERAPQRAEPLDMCDDFLGRACLYAVRNHMKAL